MFRKLQLQMTLFCTAATGAILFSLTLVCLLTAERGLVKNGYISFLNESNSILSHLKEQDIISLQWLNQLREKNGFEFIIYDNGSPLFFQSLAMTEDTLGSGFVELAAKTAKETYNLDLFSRGNSQLSSHAEFSLVKEGGDPYYICAAKIPKEAGQISFLAFYSLQGQKQQLFRQRLFFALADIFGIFLLAAFSRFFTGRMLAPLEENNRKQTQFIASASHELRTPLAVILSGLEAMEKSKNPLDRRHFAELLQKEGKRMQRLISDLLLLANSDANSLKMNVSPCQPDELLLAAYEKYELLAEKKKISLSLRLPDTSLPTILCDPERILQVLSILTDNALSYTPSGGRVTLALFKTSDVSFPGKFPAGKYVAFTVSDTGSGIPKEDRERIFERFYRAESSRTDKNHFGLGLCIARELIEAHHGNIFVAETAEQGACLVFTLPYA